MRAIETTAATAAWRRQALAKRPHAHQSAACSTSAAQAGRNTSHVRCAASAGALTGSSTSGTVKYSTSASAAYSHAPRNLPSTNSRSRTGAESVRSIRPDIRSSATRRMVSSAVSTGSAGAAASAHSTATGVSPPSPPRRAFAKRPPDTPRNTATARVVERDPASAPNVRIVTTRTVLTTRPPLLYGATRPSTGSARRPPSSRPAAGRPSTR